MDLGLTEQQTIFRAAAREFLEAECPTSLVRAVEESGEEYSVDLWRTMASLGWLGLGIPEEYGGSGGTVADQVVLFEELGRALAPGPMLFSAVVCAQTILLGSDEALRSRFVPALVAGHTIMTPAPGTGRPSSLNVHFEGGDYRVSGTALFVPFAEAADYLLCRLNAPDGETLLVVDAGTDGLAKSRMESVAGYPQYEIDFQDAAVVPGSVFLPGPAGLSGWQAALSKAMALQCASSVGRAEKVLEMVAAYSKERVQFGRPIGSFQAIQHRCADLRVAIDGARLLTHQAAWRLDQGEDGSMELIMAAHQANTASREATVAGHAIFAGISYTVEHDMQLYSSRAKIAEAALGFSANQLRALSGLMGLPG